MQVHGRLYSGGVQDRSHLRPLTRCNREGTVYQRTETVETQIVTALTLSPWQLIERAQIADGSRRKVFHGLTKPLLVHRLSVCLAIGLGHLGQAYLWALGMLPDASPQEVQLVLQDYDALVLANDSPSLLPSSVLLGEKKTRAMARWCEERGFRTAIVERRFNEKCWVNDDEPHVALCGVENPMARAALEQVGFRRVIEAGLGWGTSVSGLPDTDVPIWAIRTSPVGRCQ